MKEPERGPEKETTRSTVEEDIYILIKIELTIRFFSKRVKNDKKSTAKKNFQHMNMNDKIFENKKKLLMKKISVRLYIFERTKSKTIRKKKSYLLCFRITIIFWQDILFEISKHSFKSCFIAS